MRAAALALALAPAMQVDATTLRTVVDSALAARGIRTPVVVAALRADGTPTVYAAGAPAAANAVFAIGSLSKQFTAAAVLQLAETGRLSLDDTVQRFLPGFATPGRRVTLRALLTHTSGIPGGLRVPATAAVDRVPFEFEPGTGWSYSNAGYQLLGRVVERVSGVSFAAYVADHLATPLGLTDTLLCDERLAAGTTAAAAVSAAFAAGGICSTATDLARWSVALARGHVVSHASYETMIRPTTLPDGTTVPYGAGLQPSSLGAHPEHMHEGAVADFTAGATYYARDSLAVVVLAHAPGVPALAVARGVAARLLDVATPAPRDLPLAAAERERLVGLYGAGTIACRVVPVGDGIGYGCGGGDVPRRMHYQGGGVFAEPTAPESQLVFTLPAGAGTATGFRELYFGLPLTVATRVDGARRR